MIPSFCGAFLQLKFSIICFISSLENFTSSLVVTVPSAVFLIVFWCVFSSALTSSKRLGNRTSNVSCTLVVSDPSGFVRLVILLCVECECVVCVCVVCVCV